jgi:hypothetical protein
LRARTSFSPMLSPRTKKLPVWLVLGVPRVIVAVHRPSHHHVETALCGVSVERIECRALVATFCAADAVIFIDNRCEMRPPEVRAPDWRWFGQGLRPEGRGQRASLAIKPVLEAPRGYHLSLYNNYLFIDTRPTIAEAIEFTGLANSEIGRDFCTPPELFPPRLPRGPTVAGKLLS